MLIKPFTGTVNSSGNALVQVTQGIADMVWVIYQLGLALNESAVFPQAGAQYNGVPLASSVALVPSPFSTFNGFSPYAMLGFMVGPPYLFLSTSDQLNMGLVGGTSGDTFTVAVFCDELSAADAANMTMAGTFITLCRVSVRGSYSLTR